MNDLDVVIADSLKSMFDYILAHTWRGDEREAVKLFVFDHLVERCRAGSVLHDPAQVEIDVSLPNPEGIGTDHEVAKDLVVWPEAGGARRRKDGRLAHGPLAVMEWKVSPAGMSSYDLAWLIAFSDGHPDFTGYAVSLYLGGGASGLRCDRVHQQVIQPAWFSLTTPVPD